MEIWVEKGLLNIGDIIDTKGHILSLTDIKDNFNVSCDFLSYIKLKKGVKQLLGTGTRYKSIKQFPQLHYVFHILELSTKGNKNIYHNNLERNLGYLTILR